MSKLNLLSGWAGAKGYSAPRSAQGYLSADRMAFATSGCGSSCGSEETTPAEEPVSRPTGCGAADDREPTVACGTSCGAGEGK